VAAKTLFDPKSILAPNVIPILALVDGIPTSAAMGLLTPEGVGGYWGATSPQANRLLLRRMKAPNGSQARRARFRGLAEICAREVQGIAFEQGARHFFCQASGSGEGVWRRMGFERVNRYYR